MKNFMPLILAVILGLAAVLAVGRLLAVRKQAVEEASAVVAATRAIPAGEELAAASVMKKSVPLSARPAQAIPWSKVEMIYGQKALRSIAENDYVLLSDIGLTRSMATMVGAGEWAVPLTVAGRGISRFVQPGDEVAVIGTFQAKRKIRTADESEPVKEEHEEVTITLFPRVRVLDVGGMSTGLGNDPGNSDIILALPPQQAMFLVAAQRQGELVLALRRSGDETAINRMDVGIIDDLTFERQLNELKSVELPKVPGVVNVAAPVQSVGTP